MPAAKTAAAKSAAATDDQVVAVDWKPEGAAAKLAYIQTHIKNVEKTGVNTHHNYNYFQEHGLLDLIRPLMRELHCALVPSPTAKSYTQDQQSAYVSGYLDFIDTDESPFVSQPDGTILVEVESGQPVLNPRYMVRAHFANEGRDPQDKATNKALTGWFKYALQKLFAVPTEGIDDADHSEVAKAGARTASKPEDVPPEAVKIIATAATELKERLANLAVEGVIDANKAKAKLTTYKLKGLEEMTVEQFDEFSTWLDAEIAKSTPADSE